MVEKNDNEENEEIVIFSQLLTKSLTISLQSKIICSKSGEDKFLLLMMEYRFLML